jgi:hypothetical protein
MATASLCSAARRALPLLLTLLFCLAASSLALAVEPTTLARSDQPQTLSGEGEREFLVEGPFSLAWQSAGGHFAVEATAEGAARPSAASATQGKGQGRLKLRGAQRYRIAIAADGPWTVTVSW